MYFLVLEATMRDCKGPLRLKITPRSILIPELVLTDGVCYNGFIGGYFMVVCCSRRKAEAIPFFYPLNNMTEDVLIGFPMGAELLLGWKYLQYHKTWSTYINTFIKYGFKITKVAESLPSEKLAKDMPNQLRISMMTLISAKL
ncbi:hypothetical protein BDF21DRAFT_456389 [Thamnidium elegans]|nr:hypothetical protein BDF21DRAFT_456389 [Thamnidium elegans]